MLRRKGLGDANGSSRGLVDPENLKDFVLAKTLLNLVLDSLIHREIEKSLASRDQRTHSRDRHLGNSNLMLRINGSYLLKTVLGLIEEVFLLAGGSEKVVVVHCLGTRLSGLYPWEGVPQ